MRTGRVLKAAGECVFRRKRVMDSYRRSWELCLVHSYCHVDMKRY